MLLQVLQSYIYSPLPSVLPLLLSHAILNLISFPTLLRILIPRVGYNSVNVNQMNLNYLGISALTMPLKNQRT